MQHRVWITVATDDCTLYKSSEYEITLPEGDNVLDDDLVLNTSFGHETRHGASKGLAATVTVENWTHERKRQEQVIAELDPKIIGLYQEKRELAQAASVLSGLNKLPGTAQELRKRRTAIKRQLAPLLKQRAEAEQAIVVANLFRQKMLDSLNNMPDVECPPLPVDPSPTEEDDDLEESSTCCTM